MSLTLVIFSLIATPTFGDGLTQEELTGSLGSRKADLLIRIIPSVVTTETLQSGEKPIVGFRLFDSNTNQTLSHVTYYIIIEKDAKRLLFDLFHDHGGDLKIKVRPNTTGNISISGDRTPLLDRPTDQTTGSIRATH